MVVKPSHYEALLAEYSDHRSVIELLKQFRPYLEMVPSMRRPKESVIAVPLPLIRVRATAAQGGGSEMMRLPCDIGILMCDPEWKIKTGVEICIFIYRSGEDLSDFLGRWRDTQMLLNRNYEWVLPPRYRHIMSDGADDVLPLFVVMEQTPARILKGLRGACLPYVIQTPSAVMLDEEPIEDIEELDEKLIAELASELGLDSGSGLSDRATDDWLELDD
jgi:hypothetical protein